MKNSAVAHCSPVQCWRAPTTPLRPTGTSAVWSGANRRSPAPPAAFDLRRQLVSSVKQNSSLPAVQGAILQASHDLVAQQDWQQLQAVFATARAQQQPSGVAQQKTAGGWGFALRQPGQPRQQQQAPPAAGANKSPPPPGWDLHRVQQLRVLGLGSTHALLAEQQSSQGAASPPPARLGFRLMQLALAVALQQHLLPGLTTPPTAFDPEFEPPDVELLSRLGFAVPPLEPGHAVTGPTLLYMPCCPRHLYSDVLAANMPDRLHQLAILGTSMSSLSNTQSLFSALVGEGTDAGSSGTGQLAGSSTLGDAQQQQQQADMVSLAYMQGRVVELPCPDCSAHGVGVSVHMFKQRP